MFISVCAFSLMDIIVKWSEAYPLGQVLFLEVFWSYFVLHYYAQRKYKIFIILKERITFFKMLIRFNCLIAIFIALEIFLSYCCKYFFAAPIFTTIFSIFLFMRKLVCLDG